MNYKETVVKCDTSMTCCRDCHEYQAEISFKAGKGEGYKNGNIDGYNEATRKAIDAMFEKLQTGRKAGIREVIERYKKDNPSFYKKYQTYWDDLEKEWGIKSHEAYQG